MRSDWWHLVRLAVYTVLLFFLIRAGVLFALSYFF